MPVYSQTYRHYDGQWRPRSLAWTVIASTGIRRLWRDKGTRVALNFAFFFFLFAGVARIYLAANLDLLRFFDLNRNQLINEVFTIDPAFYFDFLRSMHLWCFFIALVAGSGAIAADRRSKALPLYLSKPITPLDYLFGKAGFILFYLYAVTLLPGLLLMFFHAAFTENWVYLIQNIPLAIRIFVYSSLVAVPLTVLILTLSSLLKSPEACGGVFAMLYWLPDAVIAIIDNMLGRWIWGGDAGEWWSLLSLGNLWQQLGDAIFVQTPTFDIPWTRHAIVLIGVTLALAVILYKQIRAVEVVR